MKYFWSGRQKKKILLIRYNVKTCFKMKKKVAAKKPVRKYNDGGKKGTSKPTQPAKPKSDKSYSEYEANGNKMIEVESLGRGYRKTVVLNPKTGKGTMVVKKPGGRMEQFNIDDPAAFERQKKIAKGEAGYRKGGVKKATPEDAKGWEEKVSSL
jgi:hypothetical protein